MKFYISEEGLKLNSTNSFYIHRYQDELIEAWGHPVEKVIHSGNYGLLNFIRSEHVLTGYMDIKVEAGTTFDHYSFELYNLLFKFLGQHPSYQLTRVWQYIPQLNEVPAGQSQSNYMSYNKGRFESFQQHFGENAIDWKVPAATGIGAGLSKNITVEFMAVKGDVTFINNRKQHNTINYSNTYGVKPPVFSRGAIMNLHNTEYLIVSGTASIVGEDTLHKNDLEKQTELTMDNIESLASDENLKLYGFKNGFSLMDSAIMRVYYLKEVDKKVITEVLKNRIPDSCEITWQQADVCRNDLLVEIEGILMKSA